MLILKSLVVAEMHGLGISRRIQQSQAARLLSSQARSFPLCTAWKKKAGFHLFGGTPKTTVARSTTV